MMTRIYEEAKRVIVWPGLEADDRTTAIVALGRMGAEAHEIMKINQMTFLESPLLQKTIGISTPQPYLLNTGRRRSAGLG
jgi:hypothetical protein